MAIMPDAEYLLSLTGHGELAHEAAPEGREPEGAPPPIQAGGQSAGDAPRLTLSI